MKNYDRVKAALLVIGLSEPDTLFVAPRESSYMCLHFADCPDLTEDQKLELGRLGIMKSAKYETLCISTDLLYDNKDL